MAARLKVHELLSRAELDELEAYAGERSRTVTEIRDWIQERGHPISRNAAWNWRTEFDAKAMTERFSRSSGLAKAIAGAIDKGSFEEIARGGMMTLTQAVFETTAEMQAAGTLDPESIGQMAGALNKLIGGEINLKKMLAASFEKEMAKQLGQTKERKLTAEQIAAAGKAIFGS